MARQIETAGDEVRVIFSLDEATGFLRGWDPIPGHGGDDALNRAVQQVYDALNDAFPDAGECVEIFAEPASWARSDTDRDFDWHAANFRFPREAVEAVGHDADALADWIAERTPDLLFALEDEDGRPSPVRGIRRHVA